MVPFGIHRNASAALVPVATSTGFRNDAAPARPLRSRLGCPSSIRNGSLETDFRFRVGHVNDVVLSDGNSARAAECSTRDIVLFLVEDLDQIVYASPRTAVPFRIEGQAMRYVELPWAGYLSTYLDDFFHLRNLVGGSPLPVPPIKKCLHSKPIATAERHMECVRHPRANSRFAESHQTLFHSG